MTTPQQIIDDEVEKWDRTLRFLANNYQLTDLQKQEECKKFLRSSSHRIFTQAIEMAINKMEEVKNKHMKGVYILEKNEHAKLLAEPVKELIEQMAADLTAKLKEYIKK